MRPAAAFPKGAGSLALAELPRLQLSFVDADGQVSLSISIYPFISLYLSIHLSLSIYLSIYLSIDLSIYLSIHPSIHLSIFVSVHPSIYLSYVFGAGGLALTELPRLQLSFVDADGQVSPYPPWRQPRGKY